MGSEQVERVARALCEYDIRMKRRYDTEPAKLEEMLPASIDGAWMQYVDQAGVAIAAIENGPIPSY